MIRNRRSRFAALLALTSIAALAGGCSHSAGSSGSPSGSNAQGQTFAPAQSKKPQAGGKTSSATNVLTNESATGLPSTASDNGSYISKGHRTAEAVPAAPVPGEKYQPRPDPSNSHPKGDGAPQSTPAPQH